MSKKNKLKHMGLAALLASSSVLISNKSGLNDRLAEYSESQIQHSIYAGYEFPILQKCGVYDPNNPESRHNLYKKIWGFEIGFITLIAYANASCLLSYTRKKRAREINS